MSTKNNELSNSSKVIFHLSLVLSLFIAYTVLQHEAVKKETKSAVNITPEEDIYAFEVHDFKVEELVKEKKKNKPKPITKKIILTDIIKEIEDDTNVVETIVESDQEDDEKIDNLISNLRDGEEVELEDDKIYDFKILESVPVFPGCEGGSNEDKKKCFASKMQKFIARKFDGELADNLGLISGKKRINVLFTINKKGIVVISKIAAPHKELEKEARRILEKLPQMIPGMQRNKPVNVRYILPISFHVE